jgi:hypothetical protein
MLVLGVAAFLALLAYQKTQSPGWPDQDSGGSASRDIYPVRRAGI